MKNTVNEHWEFWKPIVENEDGTINIEQVKKELSDFSFVIEQVPKVYCAITGDLLSKCMYDANTVISAAEDHYRNHYIEAAKEMFTDLRNGGEINQNVYTNLMENIERYL